MRSDALEAKAKPPVVAWAMGLLWLAFVLSAVTTPFTVRFGNPPQLLLLLIVIISMAIVLAFTLLLDRGYGWVRFVWSALYFATLWKIVATNLALFPRSPVAATFTMLITSLNVAALAMLFTGPARAWFAEKRRMRRAGV